MLAADFPGRLALGVTIVNSKAFLLAAEAQITDPSITRQLQF